MAPAEDAPLPIEASSGSHSGEQPFVSFQMHKPLVDVGRPRCVSQDWDWILRIDGAGELFPKNQRLMFLDYAKKGAAPS